MDHPRNIPPSYVDVESSTDARVAILVSVHCFQTGPGPTEIQLRSAGVELGGRLFSLMIQYPLAMGQLAGMSVVLALLRAHPPPAVNTEQDLAPMPWPRTGQILTNTICRHVAPCSFIGGSHHAAYRSSGLSRSVQQCAQCTCSGRTTSNYPEAPGSQGLGSARCMFPYPNDASAFQLIHDSRPGPRQP